MKDQLVPACFGNKDVYRNIYPARIQEFTEAGRQAGFTPAHQDTKKVAVILVDYQHDFVSPKGKLYVDGAQKDVARFLSWFYKNARNITSIYVSMDTHLPFQIFFSSWWRNPKTKECPQPFTEITKDHISKEIWVPVFEPDWSTRYVDELEKRLKKKLMIWPYHTLEGTLGHVLSTPISEAIAWHSAARNKQPIYIVKGRTIRTEYYGIFEAEIPDPKDRESVLDIALFNAIIEHDKIYVAGEAKSHCVLESAKQLVNHFGSKKDLFRKLYFLKDCTSSIKHPTIDFDALAEEELSSMAKNGVNIVSSKDDVF